MMRLSVTRDRSFKVFNGLRGRSLFYAIFTYFRPRALYKDLINCSNLKRQILCVWIFKKIK